MAKGDYQKYGKKYYEKNKELYKEARKKWVEANKERAKELQAKASFKYYLRRYKLNDLIKKDEELQDVINEVMNDYVNKSMPSQKQLDDYYYDGIIPKDELNNVKKQILHSA